jgi:hypothetical protein
VGRERPRGNETGQQGKRERSSGGGRRGDAAKGRPAGKEEAGTERGAKEGGRQGERRPAGSGRLARRGRRASTEASKEEAGGTCFSTPAAW